MKKVVVFGAGMVAGAHVEYLLDHGFEVTVASRTLSKAQELVKGHRQRPRGGGQLRRPCRDGGRHPAARPRGQPAALRLPPRGRQAVHQARRPHGDDQLHQAGDGRPGPGCEERGRDPAQRDGRRPGHRPHDCDARDQQGAGRGRQDHQVHLVLRRPARARGERQPLRLQVLLGPRGVLLAGKNPAHYLWDGEEVDIKAGTLFEHFWTMPIEVEGKVIEFEGYPNRDSMPYMDTYGIQGARTMFRGTLRNLGWCTTLSKISDLGPAGRGAARRPRGADLGAVHAETGRAGAGDLKADLAAKLGLDVGRQAGDRPGVAGRVLRRAAARGAEGADRHAVRPDAREDGVRAGRARPADPAPRVRGANTRTGRRRSRRSWSTSASRTATPRWRAPSACPPPSACA